MTITPALEAYLSLNLLLAATSLFLRASPKAPGAVLHLARLALLSCLVAPFAMSLLTPPHGPAFAAFVRPHAAAEPSAPAASSGAAAATPPPSAPVPSRWPALRDLLPLLLAAGAAWHLARLARDAAAARRIVRAAVPLRRYRSVRVAVSDACAIPFSVRLGATAHIVLPSALLGDARALAIAVAHEGQHHRQGDCLFAYAVELVCAACFWNPGARRWRRVLEDLQEFSCDEALVGRRRFSPHDYGHCLLAVARAALPPTPASRQLACAPAMARQGRGAPPSLLLRRIQMLPRYPSAFARSSLTHALCAFALVAAPFGAAFAARGSVAARGEAPDRSAVDPRLQRIVDHELRAGVRRLHAQSGAALLMDPVSGRVLAFAEQRADPARESWATRVFVPASTVKPFILAGALEAGATAAGKAYDCRGPIAIDGRTFENWGTKFTSVDATQAIAQSVNVCMIRIAQEAGAGPTRAALARFGLAPRWEAGVSDELQLAEAAIGDSEPVTIAGLTRAFATLGNGGKTPGTGVQAVSAATAATVRDALVEVVRSGTGQRVALRGVQLAGKTGTSVIGAAAAHAPLLAMFGGFAPAANPRYALFVVVEDGRTANGEKAVGATGAGPIFREVMRRAFDVKH